MVIARFHQNRLRIDWEIGKKHAMQGNLTAGITVNYFTWYVCGGLGVGVYTVRSVAPHLARCIITLPLAPWAPPPPANTWHCPCVVSMLGPRRWRLANIEPTHAQCPVFAGGPRPNEWPLETTPSLHTRDIEPMLGCCWPKSATLAQHQPSIGSMSRACWGPPWCCNYFQSF